jgi:hypothetical protein
MTTAEQERIAELGEKVGELAADFERLKREALVFRTISEATLDGVGCPSAAKAHRPRTGSPSAPR